MEHSCSMGEVETKYKRDMLIFYINLSVCYYKDNKLGLFVITDLVSDLVAH